MLHRALSHPLPPEFQFAGFTWPRYLATLPRGPLAARIAARKAPPCTGGYYHAPTPGAARGRGFYLGDAGRQGDGQPAPRWTWADEVEGVTIRHHGWYCTEDQDQTIRGLVLHLPHGRHLAGWSMGEHMASSVEPEVYTDAAEAAHAADECARVAAEAEQEYQAKESARIAAEEAAELANEAEADHD
jgi:hypothetical protein